MSFLQEMLFKVIHRFELINIFSHAAHGTALPLSFWISFVCIRRMAVFTCIDKFDRGGGQIYGQRQRESRKGEGGG